MEQVREIDGEQAYEKMRRAVEKASQEKASQEKARQVERARLEWASSPYLDSSCQGSCSFFRIQLIWALATKLGCWVEARSFAAGPESLSDHLLLLGSLA